MASIFSCALKITTKDIASISIKTESLLEKNMNNFVKVPEIPKRKKCTDFTYCGIKILNILPKNIRETQNINIFKSLVKDCMWEETPSY